MFSQYSWLFALFAVGNSKSLTGSGFFGEQSSLCASQTTTELLQIIQNIHSALQIENIILYKAEKSYGWHEDWAALLQMSTDIPLITLAFPTQFIRQLSIAKEVLILVEMPVRWHNATTNADMLQQLHRILLKLHASPMLFLFRTQFVEAQLQYFVLQQVFPLDFLNINAIFQRNCALEAYSYAPLLGFNIINRTRQLHYPAQLFPDPVRDLRGYTLRSPVRYDAPRAFAYKRPDGQVKLAGIGTYILQLYMQLHNGSFADLPLLNHTRTKNVHMSEIFELIMAGVIEMSPHLYGFLLKDTIEMSYPVLLTRMCLIAPKKCSSKVTLSALHANNFTMWFYLVAIMLLCTISAYLGIYYNKRTPLLSLGRAFNAIILLLLYQPPQPKLQRNLAHIFMLAPMYLFGFLLSQLYSAILLSMQTKGPTIPDILSVQDFIAAGIEIMVPDYEVNYMLNRTEGTYPAQFLNLIRPTDVDVLEQHRTSLNNSYAYALSSERWRFIAAQQEYQQPQVFHRSEVCFHQYQLYLPIRRSSPFLPSLNAFLLRAAQLGFFIEWQRQAIRDGFAAGILQTRNDCPVRPHSSIMCNEFAQFEFLWIIYLVGLACSLVVFTMEVTLLRYGNMPLRRSSQQQSHA